MIPVTRSSMPKVEDYVARINKLWDSRWLTNTGVMHDELAESLKTRMNVKHVQLFTNGHIALEMGIQALGLSGEVITTPFTFASTTQAIIRNGLTPVFCDIDENTFNIDAKKIEPLITAKTSAILAVHVYGIPCDVIEIERIAKKHNLKVIYDAAHAFDINYLGRSIAEYGDLSMFSFHATKVFHTVEGGCCVYNDENLSKNLVSLRNFGFNQEASDVTNIGGNGKMSEFHAAMGLCNLVNLDAAIMKRKKATKIYDIALEKVDGLQLFPTITVPLKRNYSYYPVRILSSLGKTRDEIVELLKQNNIIARKYFYPLASDFACYKGIYDPGYTPVAEDVSSNVLCLPLYEDLQEADIDQICKILISA